MRNAAATNFYKLQLKLTTSGQRKKQLAAGERSVEKGREWKGMERKERKKLVKLLSYGQYETAGNTGVCNSH